MAAIPDVEAYEMEIEAALAFDREWLARAIYRDACASLSEAKPRNPRHLDAIEGRRDCRSSILRR